MSVRFTSFCMATCDCSATALVLCSGSPVEGANVTVTFSGVTIAAGITDASGDFKFGIVSGHVYVISAVKTGTGSGSTTAFLNAGDTAEVNICPATGLSCSPCAIPRSDLTLSYSGIGGQSGGGTLAWNGADQWFMSCRTDSSGNGVTAQVKCFTGIIQLQIVLWNDAACATDFSLVTRTGDDPPTSYSCSPFSFTWGTGSPGLVTLTG